MSHSQVFVAVHVVFASKNRVPVIPSALLPTLHGVIGNLINESGGKTILVGGTRDHVHAAFLLSQDKSLVTVVRQVKGLSSKWLTGQKGILGKFEWQGGYGAFSVSPSQVDVLKNYIKGQEQHHRFVTFDHEFQAFLQKYTSTMAGPPGGAGRKTNKM